MNVTKTKRKEIGLAIVGCGTIGRIRAEIARTYPGVGWIGLCDVKSDIGQTLARDVEADFFTTDYRELLKRPESHRDDHRDGRELSFRPDDAGGRTGARPVH